MCGLMCGPTVVGGLCAATRGVGETGAPRLGVGDFGPALLADCHIHVRGLVCMLVDMRADMSAGMDLRTHVFAHAHMSQCE